MRQALTIAILLALLPSDVHAQTVTGWRGDGSGVFKGQHPPTRWSKDDNVVWAVKMPDRSNSQPVVAGDKIFVCSEPFELQCLRQSDGKLLWKRSNSYRDLTTAQQWVEITKELDSAAGLLRRKAAAKQRVEELNKILEKDEANAKVVASLKQAEAGIARLDAELTKLPLATKYKLPVTQQRYNGFTTATPTSDGKLVWCVFGNRVVVCYDIKGNLKWSTILPDLPQAMWGHSTSPLLVGDKLIVCIDGIVALDANTGKQVWRSKYGQGWGSPVAAKIGTETVIFMSNGRMFRASDGKQVSAECAPLERASPVVYDDALYFVGNGGNAYDFPEKVGDKLELKERWAASTRGGLFTASPVVFGGLVYTVSSKLHVLNVLDAQSGKTVYVKRLSFGREPTWSSLSAAGKYVYVTNRDGTTLVLEAGRTYKEVARNRLEYVISSPVFHKDRMYLRTSGHLYCIGKN